MKKTHILRALVLLTLFRPDTTFAATAPSTLADMVYYDSGGIAALRVGGSRWIALQPDGTYVFLLWYPTQLVGGSSVLAGLAAPPRNGRYTYTKLGNTTGRLQLISDTGNSTSTIELEFTADDSGFAQYSASTGSELAPGAGFLAAFRISPLANRKLAPLVNVSLRGNVARGRPLIAGFVVPAGTTAATLLIRVVGRRSRNLALLASGMIPSSGSTAVVAQR